MKAALSERLVKPIPLEPHWLAWPKVRRLCTKWSPDPGSESDSISMEKRIPKIHEREERRDKIRMDIPQDTAPQLCAEIRQQYQGKWWTFAGMQCMGRTAATKGDVSKQCVSNAPGYRGCNLVNARYDGRSQ